MSTKSTLERAIAILREKPSLAHHTLVIAGEMSADLQYHHGRTQVITEAVKALLPLEREGGMIFAMDLQDRLIDQEVLFLGARTRTTVDLQIIFRWLLRRERPVNSFYFAHNHPHFNVDPSAPDINLTQDLIDGARLLGMHLEDHFIIGEGGFVRSLRHGIIFDLDGRVR